MRGDESHKTLGLLSNLPRGRWFGTADLLVAYDVGGLSKVSGGQRLRRLVIMGMVELRVVGDSVGYRVAGPYEDADALCTCGCRRAQHAQGCGSCALCAGTRQTCHRFAATGESGGV